ncbi:hypothetical protein [Oscillatoria sp. FACHB-1406]|uniref:hypothetical protein n=1 Tax=Oscillatoria sp. FACHB-1406 TaxID=2692846 RepID=UPI0016826EA3|nr:hypothetical protein [Oscillatoria sp. FACHB-1406]MBD2576265.1 hypothetical protein [Oscillatoria sp. FACHB-1406]
MERGLLWLPLLVLFFWLAWAGWNEYQKLEAYRGWAESFDRAKYDIYAVLGQKDDTITWGKPTRKGPIDLQSFSLKDVELVRVLVGERAIDWDAPPARGSAAIEFQFANAKPAVQIPFTEIPLALQWAKFLDSQSATRS